MNYSKKINPVNGQEYTEAQFNAKLISVNADNVQELNNAKKTQYILGVIEFENASGNKTTASAQIFLANWKYGMEVGQSYLATARITDSTQPPLVSLSHLTGAPRATADDFGFNTTVAQNAPEVKAQVESVL